MSGRESAREGREKGERRERKLEGRIPAGSRLLRIRHINKHHIRTHTNTHHTYSTHTHAFYSHPPGTASDALLLQRLKAPHPPQCPASIPNRPPVVSSSSFPSSLMSSQSFSSLLAYISSLYSFVKGAIVASTGLAILLSALLYFKQSYVSWGARPETPPPQEKTSEAKKSELS